MTIYGNVFTKIALGGIGFMLVAAFVSAGIVFGVSQTLTVDQGKGGNMGSGDYVCRGRSQTFECDFSKSLQYGFGVPVVLGFAATAAFAIPPSPLALLFYGCVGLATHLYVRARPTESSWKQILTSRAGWLLVASALAYFSVLLWVLYDINL